MEGAGGGGFGYVNLQNNPSLYRPSPPLTAIERFFSSKNNHFSHKQTQNNVHNQGLLVPASVYGGFSSSGGAIGGYLSDFLGPSFPEKSFMDRLFHDSKTLKWTYEIDPNMGLSEDDKSTERNCKGVAKRAKGGSSTTTLIKGQWTDEEDRKLLNLVTQHGVRKWAQMAENMVGRAGKQCRERWHNHLRPDIKEMEDRYIRFEKSRKEPHSISRSPDPISYRAQVPFSGQRSFIEVLKGVTPTVAKKESLSIKANEEDLEWLHGSVIVRFISKFSTVNIGNILKEKGLDHVMVRKEGGRDLVLTFKSQEEPKSNLCNIKEWFKEWSQFVMEWKPGFFLEQERCVVATSCMEFINKTISLDCKGILHPILVCEDLSAKFSSFKGNGLEECSSNEICGSVVKRTSPKECFREKKPDDVMQVNSVVEESKWDEEFIREEEVCTKEVDQRSGSNDCYLGEEVNTVIEETILEESVHNPNFIVEQVSTPGFIKSVNGSRVGSGFGINLEVDLSQALSKNLNRKGLLSFNQSGLVRQPTSVPKLLRNEKRKRKKKVQLEGFTSFASLNGQKAAAVSKHTSKSIIFRPAAAAIERSDLSERITSPNNLLLNEAKAILQLGKSLGINFNGEEDDVLNKIIEVELKDKKRSK
ncbi:unnamed protein product [Camellia sinensis]